MLRYYYKFIICAPSSAKIYFRVALVSNSFWHYRIRELISWSARSEYFSCTSLHSKWPESDSAFKYTLILLGLMWTCWTGLAVEEALTPIPPALLLVLSGIS